MRKAYFFLFFLFALAVNSFAQNEIKINGVKFNKIDRKGNMQGNWIFYDERGNVKMTTFYENNKAITPFVFYINGDTSFVRFPEKSGQEEFIYYKSNTPVYGAFINMPGNNYRIEIDSAYTADKEIIDNIMGYRNLQISPVYMFAQEKFVDHIAARFTASNFNFNKPIYAILYLSESGVVIKVDFPKQQNNLNMSEETELNRIYTGLARWQPEFRGTKTVKSRVVIKNNNTADFIRQ